MQTFKKGERLTGDRLIEKLYEKGHSFVFHPLLVKWLPDQKGNAYPIRLVISVSKRRVKKAVDRNRLKRQIREAWRKSKADAYESLKKLDKRCLLMIIYRGENKAEYKEIESKIILILHRL